MRSKEDRRTLYICSTCANDEDNCIDDAPHLQQHQRLTRYQQPRTLKYYLLQQKRLWIYLLSLILTVIIATPSILRRIVIVSAFTIPVTVKRSLQKIIVTVIRSPKSGIIRSVTPSKQRRQQQFWSLQLTPYEEYMNSRRESEQQLQQQSSSTPSNSNIENTNENKNGVHEDMKFTFVPPNERKDTTLPLPVTTNQFHNNYQTPNINSVPTSSSQDAPWNRDTKVYTFVPQRKQEEAPNNGHLNDTNLMLQGSTSTLGGNSNGMYRTSPSNALTTPSDSSMSYTTVFPTNHYAPIPPASSINESNHFSSVHDSNHVSNIGNNGKNDADRSSINEDTRECIQYERNDSIKSAPTSVSNSWDSYYNNQNQQNGMPQSTISTNVPSAAAMHPATLESQMLPNRQYSMGENIDNGAGFVTSTEDQSMRTSEPELSLPTSSNIGDVESRPATVVPPSSSTLQHSNSLWNENISSRSKSVNDERHDQHDPTMNSSLDEKQHRPFLSDQTVTDNLKSRNPELEGKANMSQQQLPNIATHRTDHTIPELRGDNNTIENHDNGSNVHKVNARHASATSNQVHEATMTNAPFSVQRSPEQFPSTLSNEDSKDVSMASTLTPISTPNVIETSSPDEFRNTIDPTNFQRQNAPILQHGDQKSQKSYGTTVPVTLPHVPSLEVVSQIRDDPRTNPDDRSSFDVISTYRDNSNTAINVELPQKPSFDNIGPVTPTTTMLFATTLISCDEDIKCDNVVNVEKNLVESHQEESQCSPSLEMQIELAEAMFAKSDHPLGTLNDNNDRPVTSTTARHIERRDNGQSHVLYNLTSTPADRELTSLPVTRFKNDGLGTTSNNFDKAESISSFGHIIATMSDSGTRVGNPRYEIEHEKNQMGVKWTEKLECSAPDIDNADMLDKKATPPMMSVEHEMSIGSIEYPRPTTNLDVRGMTERIMKKIDGATQGSNMYVTFKQLESEWARVKQQSRFKAASSAPSDAESSRPRIPFVTSDAVLGNPRCWAKLREHAHSATTDYDITIHGGTQGIVLALSLLRQNPTFRVCVVASASKLCIDDQEWNVSSTELNELVKFGILNEPDVQDIILSKMPSGRFGFQNNDKAQLKGEYFGYDSAEDESSTLCLSSSLIVERITKRFRQAGGVILEGTKIYGISVSTTVGAALDIGESSEPITTKLLIDCAGKSSPILSQQQASAKPDGLCAIVGTRAAGYGCSQQTRGDVVYTMATMKNDFSNEKLQYFSEAPTAELDDRVIYMFTFMDADQDRQSFESLIDDYWKALPKYQPGIVNPEVDLNIKQLVLTYFPTYAISPLQPQFDRIVSIGDASSTESPFFFGSLGAQCRHLGWFTSAINAVFDKDQFDKSQLAEIYTFAPILSSAWMYQKAAAIKMRHVADKSFVKQLLSVKMETTTQQTNFGQSAKLFQENSSITPHSGQQMQPIHSHYGSKNESRRKSHELSTFPKDQRIIDERTIQKKFDASEPNNSSITTKESHDVVRLNDSTINANLHVVPMETSKQGTIGSSCTQLDQRTTFGSTENSRPIDQTSSLPETSTQTQHHSGTTELSERPQAQQLHNFGFERSTSTAVEKELGSQDKASPIEKEHFENPAKHENSSFDASVWGGQPGNKHMNTECINRNGREIEESLELKENLLQSYGASSQIENISPQRHPNVYSLQDRPEPLELKDHTHQEGKRQASLFEATLNTGVHPPNHGFGISQSDSSVVATKSMYDNSSGGADSLARTGLNKIETMRSDAFSSTFDRNSDRHSTSNIHHDHDVVSTPTLRATEEPRSESMSHSTVPSIGAPRESSVRISSQETWNNSNASNRIEPVTFSTTTSQNTSEQYSNSNAGERLQSVQSYISSDGLRSIGHRQDSSTEGVEYQQDIFPNVNEPTMAGTEIGKSHQIRGYSFENIHDQSDRRSTDQRYDTKVNDISLTKHDHSTIVSQQGHSPVPSYVDTKQSNNDQRTTEPMQTYPNNRQPLQTYPNNRQPLRKDTSSHPYHYSTSYDGYASHPTSFAAIESNPNMQNVQQLGVSSMPDRHSTIESQLGYGSIPKSSAQSDREYQPNYDVSSPLDQHAQTTTANHRYFPAPTSSAPAENYPHIQQHRGNLPLPEQNTGSTTQHVHASDQSFTVPTQSYSEQYQQRQSIPIPSFQGQHTESTSQHEHTRDQTLNSQMQRNYNIQQQHDISSLQSQYTNQQTPTPSQSGHASVPTSTTPVTQYAVEQHLQNQHTNQRALLQSERGHASVPTSTAPVPQYAAEQHLPNQHTQIQSQSEHASVPTRAVPVSQYADEQQQQQSHHAQLQVAPSVVSLQPNQDGSGRRSLDQPYQQFTSAAPAAAPYDDGFSRYRLSQDTASILPDKGMGSASSNSRR